MKKSFFINFIKNLVISFLILCVITFIYKCVTRKNIYNTIEQNLEAVEIYDSSVEEARKELENKRETSSEDEFNDYVLNYIHSTITSDEDKTLLVRAYLFNIRYAHIFCKKHNWHLSEAYDISYRKIYKDYIEKNEKEFSSFSKEKQKFYNLLEDAKQHESAEIFLLNLYKEIQKEMPDLTTNEFCQIIDDQSDVFLSNVRDIIATIIPDYLNEN